MRQTIKNISVIGDGGWGTTLAIHLAHKKYAVTLWGPFPDYIQLLKEQRENIKFLPEIPMPDNLNLSDDLSAVIPSAELIVFAIPSKYALKVLNQIQNTRVDLDKKIFLSVTKGIDVHSLQTLSRMAKDVLGPLPIAVLSGPTIAMEVARGIPSSAVIASNPVSIAKNLQHVFHSTCLRIYTNTDVKGVEIGGSLKNIMALACGVCDGLGFGTNTKSALLTRSLAEMARLGKALGAQQKTFSGLSGLGDLVTTCFSPHSRNRSVGERIGKGEKIKDILRSMEMVAEGVDTAKSVYQLSQQLNISMPVTEQVYKIIYQNKSPHQAVSDLMTRKVKAE
ncbi:MAG: NAD(P)-dependent glycerol-3-phosphate dehydrogenase [Candidatus Omnitrophica bacterium]|nr:NAD(P)-dependent glycerol-3-phosphate dehydrogenase [Candidatus Omnitrophota bacterium]